MPNQYNVFVHLNSLLSSLVTEPLHCITCSKSDCPMPKDKKEWFLSLLYKSKMIIYTLNLFHVLYLVLYAFLWRGLHLNNKEPQIWFHAYCHYHGFMDVPLDIKVSEIWRLSGILSCEQKVKPWNKIYPRVSSGRYFIQNTAQWLNLWDF